MTTRFASVGAWVAATMLVAAGCAHKPLGRFQYSALASEVEGRRMRYGVYIPPREDTAAPLPLVVLLHGAGDDETSADRDAVVTALDDAVASGNVPPFIMVTPDGDRGFWMNWYDGSHRYKDWVLEEVVPAVRARHATITGPGTLHLVGVSMGGGGGMQMWLSDPGRFASATIISTPILNEQETRKFLGRFVPKRVFERAFGPPGGGGGVDPYVALASPSSLGGSRLMIGAAKRDIGGILGSNRTFHAHLQSRTIPHRFVTFDGRHGWNSWAPMIAFALCHQLGEACRMPVPGRWRLDTVPAK